MATDNKSLGRFILDGIPPAPRGIPQVEVKFDIDANGILNVSAKDKASGKEQSIRIESSGEVSKEEIEKMKKDAEIHAEEDKKKQEVIEVKNQAQSAIFTVEKTMKDAGDKISEDFKKEINEKKEALDKIKDSDDIEDIKNKTKELMEVIQKAGAEMYKAQQAAQPEGQTAGEEKPQAEEAEFEEKKEEDKNEEK